MKQVKYIGESNAYLLERGDRLHMKASERMLESEHWLGPEEFDITVAGTFLTSIHGPRIYSEEKIGPDQEDDFYLVDDWTITVIP